MIDFFVEQEDVLRFRAARHRPFQKCFRDYMSIAVLTAGAAIEYRHFHLHYLRFSMCPLSINHVDQYRKNSLS
jgi:hypothetical protein